MASMGDDLSISAPVSAHAHGSKLVRSSNVSPTTDRYIVLLPPQEGVYRSRDELFQAVHTRAYHQGYNIIIQSSGPKNVNIGCKLSGKQRVDETALSSPASSQLNVI